jgi:3-methyladenine DNA glycosylase AlkD
MVQFLIKGIYKDCADKYIRLGRFCWGMLSELEKDLAGRVKPGKKELLQRFFKTGKGEYGEGDVFLGVMVPDSRKVAKKYKDLPISQVGKLLQSRIHEHRLVALLILVQKYQSGSGSERKEVFDFYLSSTKWINNWDLVDLTAHKIVGEHLLGRDHGLLYRLARSRDLWERRIAIVATAAFIKEGIFDTTLKISEMLLGDEQDLIHKAAGWMLREVGKKDQAVEERFLKKHCKVMPRTMLRYAIERFDEKKRKFYMQR